MQRHYFRPPPIGPVRGFWSGLFVLTLATTGVAAQPTAPRGHHLQLGLSGIPGVGLQAGSLSLRSFYTREFVFNAEVIPGRAGNIRLSGGLGGALRLLGFGRTLGNTGYRGYDVDIGLRFGPGLTFAFNETRSTKNRRFTLFADVFARFSAALGRRRVVYAEVGIHRPVARVGLWFPL